MNLEPCPSCGRHVRGDTCPFCGTKLSPSATPPTAFPLASRAAFLIGSAALVAGCTTTAAPAYGGPPPGPATPMTATTSSPAVLDASGPPVPPVKTGTADMPPGPAPAYGAPQPAKK